MSSKSVYLVAFYFMRPRGRALTHNKGWMDNQNNIMYDEQVTITRNLKKSDISMAKVILDLTKKTVFRNGWNDQKNFDQLFKHYNDGYPEYTKTVMGQLDPEYMKRFEPAPAETQAITSSISAPTEEVYQVDTSNVDTRVL